MKKIAYTILLAGLASVLIARAQTNPNQPVDNTNAPIADSSATNTVAPATNSAPEATPAPAVVDTNAAATAVVNATAGSVPADVSAANQPTNGAASIPLIQFSDVPITTAIENLARQAGINYMLDPKIGYGQPDQTGQLKAEPQLSIRWENITAENALLALLDNYGLQLIVDTKTGIDRITLKDPLAPPPLITRVVQLQYSSVSNMVESVQSVLGDKRSRVIGDNRTSQLLVVATESEQQSVETLIAQLDKQTKQVLIETKLIEISSNPTTKKGVDWSSTLSGQNVAFGNGNVFGTATTASTPSSTTTTTTPGGGYSATTTTPAGQNTVLNLVQSIGNGGISASTISGLIPTTGFLNADGVKAVISFLNASYDAQVVSTPRVVTLDNETAHIEVIRTYPVISMSGASANSSGSSSVTYSNVGTILDVTPRISANDKIWLRVLPEVSSHFADVTVTVAGGSQGTSSSYPVPVFDRRRMESQVMIPNGNTLVMGGLVQDSPTATYSKVPFLGDIPGLGWAFKSENKSMNKDNLIIFLTPTIVQDADFQPTESTFLQSKPRTMMSPMNPHKPWDGAEPATDWSNPAPSPGEFDKQKASVGNGNY
jgi:type II secretory pathway component GspD/PulD (secretin)